MACDIKTAKAFLEESLANLYEKRELKSIVKYYFEDKFTNKEVLNDQDEQIFFEDIALLKNHCPLQLIVGKAYFYDRFYKVNAHTLIPRPETEELVSLILETIKTAGALNLLDIGTGTGCIPISLRAHGNFDKILGIDISAEALVVAKENTTRYDLDVDFQQIDFLDQNQWKKIDTPDIIVSNPPYISIPEKSKMSANVLNYEPHLALFVKDPLIFYKGIADYCNINTVVSHVFLELNPLFADQIARLYQEVFSSVQVIKDMQGKDRMLKATRQVPAK